MSKKKYNYPIEKINKEEIEDEDDDLSKEHLRLQKIVTKLEKLPKQAQHSAEWFKGRNDHMTGSDSGCFMGVNKYEHQYKFIVKKLWKQPFSGNSNMYHGNKYEQIATMFYEETNNVKASEFGLIEHPNKEAECDFLAISPDGVVSKYKKDGQHKTNLVGRMIEIKCPVTRQILKRGDVKGKICPIYYWTQVQLQLECCDLEECDFVQCKILEYMNHDEFVNDSMTDEPWLSKNSGNYKGAVIQILPKKNMSEILENYEESVWKYSKFIYPESLKMSPYDYDKWIVRTTENMKNDHPDYFIDKIVYWKLDDYHIQLIKRDKEWFEDGLPLMKKIWNYITILRKSVEKAELFKQYLDCQNPLDKSDEQNDKMMEAIDAICNNSKKKVDIIKKEIEEYDEQQKIKDEERKLRKSDGSKKKEISESESFDNECMFSDDEDSSPVKPKKKISKIKPIKKKQQKSDSEDNGCMFSDSDDSPVKKQSKKTSKKTSKKSSKKSSKKTSGKTSMNPSKKKKQLKSDSSDNECMFSDDE